MPTVVVKLGGASLQKADTLAKLAVLIKSLQQQGHKAVVIHGGGPAINHELTSRGITWQFINGQRQTTPEMISVIDQVLGHKINSEIVQALGQAHISAKGLSGAADQILFCTQASEELQQVGEIEHVNIEKIESCLNMQEAQVPVIAPIGIGQKGEKYNINADCAAAKIAISLQAEKLIFLTDQDGILDENKKLVETAYPTSIEHMIHQGVIQGGMHIKATTMMLALKKGVKEVQVLNASSADLYGQQSLGTRLLNQTTVQLSQDLISVSESL